MFRSVNTVWFSVVPAGDGPSSSPSMGNKSAKNRGGYYYDQYNYDARSVQSSSTYGSFSLRHDDWERRSRIHSRYSRIGDEYCSLDQVLAFRSSTALDAHYQLL